MTAPDVALARDLAQEAGRMLVALRAAATASGPLDRDGARALRDRADADAHRLIVDALARQRPGDAVLSEEGVDDSRRLSSDRVWIVDPLDGTWEYGEDRDDFAVHVALWERGELVVGAVGMPARDVVLDSGSVAAAPPLPADGPVRVVVSRTRTPQALDALTARIAAALGRDVEVYRVGSAGAKAVEVVEGRAHAYVHDAGLSEWDAAAPAAVATAAGLHVSGLSGDPLAFNRMPPLVGDLMVAVPEVARAVLGR